MYDLGRLVTEAVDAENFQRIAMEQDLEHADGIAGDLGAGGVLEERLPHFVGDARLGQFGLATPHRADLGDGVDTGRHLIDELELFPQQVGRGEAALIVSRGCQARPADHIAHRIHVVQLGAVLIIDGQLTAAVGLQADILETKAVGVAGTTVGPQEGVSTQLLAGLEVHDHAGLVALDAIVFLVVTHQHAVVAQVVGQRVGNLVIQEGQQTITRIDQVDLDAKAGEDRGVLGADDTGAVDDQRARRV